MAGGITAYWFYDGYRKVWKPHRHYQQARCRVLDKDLERLTSDTGEESFKPRFKLTVLASDRTTRGYDMWGEGLVRSRAQAVLDRYPVGQDLPCWHPPGRPEAAVLSRKPDIYWMLCGALFLPCTLLFLAMTVFGLREWREGRRD